MYAKQKTFYTKGVKWLSQGRRGGGGGGRGGSEEVVVIGTPGLSELKKILVSKQFGSGADAHDENFPRT